MGLQRRRVPRATDDALLLRRGGVPGIRFRGQRGKKALDFVVSEARRHKMRLILSPCNNWEDYGRKAQYVRWGKEAGLDLTSDDDFFSDPTIKSCYKAFVNVKIMVCWVKWHSQN